MKIVGSLGNDFACVFFSTVYCVLESANANHPVRLLLIISLCNGWFEKLKQERLWLRPKRPYESKHFWFGSGKIARA